MLQRSVIALVAVWVGMSGIAAAQDRATVQMRDGSKFEGRIEEMTTGELFVRVSQHDQRRVPVGSVALIDRVGGDNGLPPTEIREATGSQHLMLLSNGSSLKGQLIAIRGGEGSANGDQPRTYVFRADGRDQSFPPEQVARIYMGSYAFGPTSANSSQTVTDAAPGLAGGNDAPGAVHVSAARGWISTGMRVRKGEFISFNTSGEVQLSANQNDRAKAAGTSRTAPGAPLPNVSAGALIGRVGNSLPFGIGDQAAVPMPFDGILYLAVNDDEHSDNAGEFVVSLARGRQ